MILKIKLLLHWLLYLPQIYAYTKSPNRELVDLDIARWNKELGLTTYGNAIKDLVRLLFLKPQFRNLFYFRCRNILNCFKKVCRQDFSINFADDANDIAGGGVYFEHAFGTRIAAKSIGYGCTFRQLITIGVKKSLLHNEKVTIGNNVDFGVNVTAIGNITIGDNAVIGAGSVVVKDVPPNAVVVGNPAHVVKYMSPESNK